MDDANDRETASQSRHAIDASLFRGLLWQRTAFSIIHVDTPEPLRQFAFTLAAVLAEQNWTAADVLQDSRVIAGTNIIRRMGDLAVYESFIRCELVAMNPYRAATLTGSLLVGFFSASKAVLDAVTIALSVALKLPLTRKEQDFAKRKFWAVLRNASRSVAEEIEPFRAFTADVVRWRDAAVHRTTPLVVVDAYVERLADKSRERLRVDESWIRMAADPEADIGSMDRNLKWIEPLDLPTAWQQKFEDLTVIAGRSVVASLQ